MAPDADKLRQRQTTAVAKHNAATISTQERLCSLSSLKGEEVCIDGIIYDLQSFDHPGGETIKMFGGNDVTVQYKMIHPYHTEKHLEKMKRVGKVTDFVCEYVSIRHDTFAVQRWHSFRSTLCHSPFRSSTLRYRSLGTSSIPDLNAKSNEKSSRLCDEARISVLWDGSSVRFATLPFSSTCSTIGSPREPLGCWLWPTESPKR